MKEEMKEFFINGKDTVPVRDIKEFKGHGGNTLHGIKISTGRAEAEGNKFKFTTARTAVHAPAKRRITAVDHFIHVFNIRITGCKV